MTTKKQPRKSGRRSYKGRRPRRRKRTAVSGWTWLAIAGVVVVLFGFGFALRPTGNSQEGVALAPPEVLAQGEAIYADTCAACHGAEGEGDVGPALNGDAHAWHHVDSQLRSFIGDGIPGTAMVGHKDHLSAEEIAAVISYLKVWWTPEQRQMQLTGQHPMP